MTYHPTPFLCPVALSVRDEVAELTMDLSTLVALTRGKDLSAVPGE
jgi:hypothetical protein